MTLRRWILFPVLLGLFVGCNNNYSSGDRVLVTKFSYDNGLTGPERYQVVVFKYPVAPIDNHTPKNYIKRLLGLPGELLAIFFGRIYRWNPPPGAPAPFDDLKDGKVLATDLWKSPYMHVDDETSRKWFNEGQFEILRKPPHIMLAMRRIVYDNDFQATDLKGKLDRWNPSPKSGWKSDGKTSFVHDGAADEIDWLHYQHLLRPEKGVPEKTPPQLITDSMSYNNLKTLKDKTIIVDYMADRYHPHWVGDLILECNVDVVAAKGEFVLELNKGIYRYQARWDLATGKCTLKSIAEDGVEKDLGTADTSVKSPGNYMLRFANVDARLTVWVDRTLPFKDGKEYDPPEVCAKGEKFDAAEMEKRRGPRARDLKPASIGTKGAAVKISHVRLWRDTYYVTSTNPGKDYDITADALSKPDQWKPIQDARFSTLYVQPGHNLCLGDNSQQSSDSRDWGLVPERLMLGRALVVYFPLDRLGAIR